MTQFRLFSDKQNRLILIISLALLITSMAFADDLLVKISPDDLSKVSDTILDRCVFRFQGKSFIIIQGDDSLLKGNLFTVLDRVHPDSLYYMIGGKRSRIQLEQLGEIILESESSLLLRINPYNQPRLISLGLPLYPLPESIKLDSGIQTWMSPAFEQNYEPDLDSTVIAEVARVVNPDGLKQTVSELQENKDLNFNNAYKSRYCLRVKETDDPSDEACDNAAEYIYNKFKSYGLEVEYDSFPHEVLTQGKYQMRNVVATLPGKGEDSQKVFIISSHYDSKASTSTNWELSWKTMQAPGADDNASGTAAVLEAARILSKYEFNSTIKFVTFTGEELGLHGSTHYANMVAKNNETIAGVLNLDMIAYDPDTPDIDVITNLGSEWLAEAMLSVQKKYNLGPLLLKKIVNPDMVFSDHASFWNNGFSAILGIDNSNFDSPEFNPYIHSEKDTIDKLNFDMMGKMCQIAIATLASLADPFDEVPHPDLAIFENDVYLSTESPGINQPVELKAYIQNIGDADANDVNVQVWIEEPLDRIPYLINEQKISVMAQKQVKIIVNFKLNEWGESKVIIKVNPDYRVFETDGRNNLATRTIKVGSNLLAMGKLFVYPNPAKLDNDKQVNIEYTLSKDSSVTLEIYNILGELVYHKEFNKSVNGGKFGINNGIKWDGKTISGEKVAPGLYICNLIASDAGTTETISEKLFVLR
jgi:hypothetical protein